MSQGEVAVIINENENNVFCQGENRMDNMQVLQSFTSRLQAYQLYLPKLNFPHTLYAKPSNIITTLRKPNAENIKGFRTCIILRMDIPPECLYVLRPLQAIFFFFLLKILNDTSSEKRVNLPKSSKTQVSHRS